MDRINCTLEYLNYPLYPVLILSQRLLRQAVNQALVLRYDTE
jgi:hypothetical protein